jgi:quinol monooxygenase YgiN
MAIVVVARIKAKPGCEKQLEDSFRSMIQKVREEPGCEAYIHIARSYDPTVFLFYDLQDSGSPDFHGKTPHMAELKSRATWLNPPPST